MGSAAVSPAESTEPSEAPAEDGSKRWSPTTIRATWTLVALGVLLRVWELAQAHSLWRDEASLVFNLRHRGLLGFTTPLDHDQGAPPGFFVLAQTTGDLLGGSEIAYRFVPFLASSVALVLAAVLSHRHLSPTVGLTAVGLLAFSNRLLFYAADVKQYSVDLAVGLGILLVADEARRRGWSPRACVGLAVAGGAAVLCSHPSVFVLAPAGLGSLFAARGDAAAVRRLLAVGATWGAVWLAQYLAWTRHLGDNDFLYDFWEEAFLPIPPTSGADLDQWTRALRTAVEPLLPRQLFWLAAVLVLAGLVHLARQRPALASLLVIPGALTVVASSVELYPAAGRMILFLLPFVAVLLGAGAEAVGDVRHRRGVSATLLPAVLLLILTTPETIDRARTTPAMEELRPALEAMRGREVDATVLVTRTASAAWDYYSDRLHLDPQRVVFADADHGDPADAVLALENVRGEPAVWVVDVAYWRPEGNLDPALLAALDAIGTRVEEHHEQGASVQLFDLRSPRR